MVFSTYLDEPPELLKGWLTFFYQIVTQPFLSAVTFFKLTYDFFIEPTHGFIDIILVSTDTLELFLGYLTLSLILPLVYLEDHSYLIYRLMMAFSGDQRCSWFLWQHARRDGEWKYVRLFGE